MITYIFFFIGAAILVLVAGVSYHNYRLRKFRSVLLNGQEVRFRDYDWFMRKGKITTIGFFAPNITITTNHGEIFVINCSDVFPLKKVRKPKTHEQMEESFNENLEIVH
jgi:hypothetical protein